MRLRIDTNDIEFRAASAPKPRMESRDSNRQKKTRDGRPVWTVRVTAFDKANTSTEMVYVEVAGDEPQIIPNEVISVQGLVFAPWVNRKGEIMRSFRAESVTQVSAKIRAAS